MVMRAAQRRSIAILVGLVSSGLMLTGLLLTVDAMPPQPGSGSPQGTRVDDTALVNEAGGEHWLAYGRTYSEQSFSPLTQISDRTVSRLRPEWFVELPNDRGLVSTPLVVDGVLYFIGSMNVVRAVDARSGKRRWQ
jgi:quinohemoprotein ethanol dehydrogenase